MCGIQRERDDKATQGGTTFCVRFANALLGGSMSPDKTSLLCIRSTTCEKVPRPDGAAEISMLPECAGKVYGHHVNE